MRQLEQHAWNNRQAPNSSHSCPLLCRLANGRGQESSQKEDTGMAVQSKAQRGRRLRPSHAQKPSAALHARARARAPEGHRGRLFRRETPG